MRATAQRWTEAEDDLLRQVYPDHGLKECARQLPARTESAIVFHVWQLRLHRTPGTMRRPGSGSRTPRASRLQPPPAPKCERQVAARPLPKAAAPAPAPPKPKTLVLKAADIRPGMIINRYPVGTTAAPALREVTEARFSDSGARVFFNLAWRPATPPKGKYEMPAAFWDFYRNPDLSFEVYADLAGGLLS